MIHMKCEIQIIQLIFIYFEELIAKMDACPKNYIRYHSLVTPTTAAY